MTDLFSRPDVFEQVHLPGADVSYLRSFNLGWQADKLLACLIEETPWRQENVTLWGKVFRQPRLIAWYGDSGRAYRYSGIELAPLPWTQRLEALRRRVEATVNHTFNSALLNYYRDQHDSMGFHSDDERELGPNPVIASISLGAERAFILKSRQNPGMKSVRLQLASGSLLLMKGDTQKNYKHGISKEAKLLGPRVNLTFREIIT